MTEPLLLPVREAARRLGLDRDSTYALIHGGKLRVVRVGRRLLIPVRELEAFVARELDQCAPPATRGQP